MGCIDVMLVLGIESSCDETAAALVHTDGTVISDVVASQIAVHAPYGGVVPELASRAHLANITTVVESALEQVDGGLKAVDAIAVTHGPGLVGALLTGVSFAKAMAYVSELPLVGVDHLVAHLLAVHLKRGSGPHAPTPTYPYIALLVSGGHTALYEVHRHDDIRILGQTRDDAVGEAFDKVAKLLGLGYPGGPIVDRYAAKGNPKAVKLPRPMASRRNLDFSFSGLKTAVARHVQTNGLPSSEQGLYDLCASFQHAVVDVLLKKSIHAAKTRGVPRLVFGGGVAANRELRERGARLAGKYEVDLFVPELASCTDNAAMIAYAGALAFADGKRDDLSLSAYSRSPELKRGKFPQKRH